MPAVQGLFPVPKPKFVLALASVVAFVPPSLMGRVPEVSVPKTIESSLI